MPMVDDRFNKELCEERHEKIDESLDRFGDDIGNLEKCTIKLTELIDRFDKSLSDQDMRISILEKRPAETVRRCIAYILTALAGAASAGILSYVEQFLG